MGCLSRMTLYRFHSVFICFHKIISGRIEGLWYSLLSLFFENAVRSLHVRTYFVLWPIWEDNLYSADKYISAINCRFFHSDGRFEYLKEFLRTSFSPGCASVLGTRSCARTTTSAERRGFSWLTIADPIRRVPLRSFGSLFSDISAPLFTSKYSPP